MEPNTYLSGLSIVILSYVWCVRCAVLVEHLVWRVDSLAIRAPRVALDHSVSGRRNVLYTVRGLDFKRRMSLEQDERPTVKDEQDSRGLQRTEVQGLGHRCGAALRTASVP